MTRTHTTASLGSTAQPTWPDTSQQEIPPSDHSYASATWLLGRHPVLTALVRRIPGAVTVEHGELDLHLHLLAEAINGETTWGRAWDEYGRRNPWPDPDQDPQGYQDWQDAGPRPALSTAAFLPLSRTEKARLRLLACFAAGERIEFSVDDTRGLDYEGTVLLRDWCLAMYHA